MGRSGRRAAGTTLLLLAPAQLGWERSKILLLHHPTLDVLLQLEQSNSGSPAGCGAFASPGLQRRFPYTAEQTKPTL